MNKATDSPAGDARFPRRPDETEEERAVRELRERVYGETGVTLGEDWTAKVEIKESSGDRRKSSGGKRRTRFYSPGGRRFSSASEVVSYVQDTLAKARVEQGLPVVPKSAERSRRSHVDYSPTKRTKPRRRRRRRVRRGRDRGARQAGVPPARARGDGRPAHRVQVARRV